MIKEMDEMPKAGSSRESIALRLKGLRISRQMSINEVAQKLCMKEEQLIAIEEGREELPFETALSLSNIYNVTMQFISLGIGTEPEEDFL